LYVEGEKFVIANARCGGAASLPQVKPMVALDWLHTIVLICSYTTIPSIETVRCEPRPSRASMSMSAV
jgi:hypothetical protein